MLISTTPELITQIKKHLPVAIGVSGGKDSSVAACASKLALDEMGHQGQRILIHSDLGRIEWKDSLTTCERLARHLEMDLIVVKRESEDLIDRWKLRWKSNVERYANLSCVKLILPWSTPSMRFCTSEFKTCLIAKTLTELFNNQTIISVTGIRRQESAARAKAAILTDQQKLKSVSKNTSGFDWNAILDWTQEEVWQYHQLKNLPVHEAYGRYGASRVSCAFCIMSRIMDLVAAASVEEHADLYRNLVQIEVSTSFSFQDKVWLGDIAPHLLSEETLIALDKAKRAAIARQREEALIPVHLLFTKHWPTVMPTYSEARLLASIRDNVADIVGISIGYTDAESIIQRYEELMGYMEK